MSDTDDMMNGAMYRNELEETLAMLKAQEAEMLPERERLRQAEAEAHAAAVAHAATFKMVRDARAEVEARLLAGMPDDRDIVDRVDAYIRSVAAKAEGGAN